MTKRVLELLRQLIHRELSYRDRLQAWLEATEEGKSEMGYPPASDRRLKYGTFDVRQGQALVRLGLARRETSDNGLGNDLLLVLEGDGND